MNLDKYLASIGTAAAAESQREYRRILGVIRLSHETDVTTSPERQREAIILWAQQHDCEIVGWAIDLDVSGGVDPWERGELGEWLKHRSHEFDGLCAWKLDRYSRSVSHFSKFLDWAKEHGKMVATSDNVLDSTTPTGMMLAYVMSICAEWERVMASQRSADMRAKARREGRYVGGRLAYGYRAVRQADRSFLVEPDPDQFKVVREMIAWRLDGWSVGRIRRELNDRQTPTPLGGAFWQQNTVNRLLTSPTLLGYTMHQGRVVCGEDGMPVRFAEPLATEEEYKALLTMADESKKTQFFGNRPKKPVTETYLLKDLARCGNCGERLYRYTRSRPGNRPDEPIYRCARHRKNCDAVPEIFLPKLERVVIDSVIGELDDAEVYAKEFVPASDVADRLVKINRAIDQHRGDRAAGVWDGEDERFRQIMTRLIDERKRLEAMPQTKAHWRNVPTGTSYGQRWAGADLEGRRELLALAGVEIVVCANTTVPAPPWWDESAPHQAREKVHSRLVYLRWAVDAV